MEVTKFWTKGKIIALLVLISIISVVTIGILMHRSELKKEYKQLSNELTLKAENYLILEHITLDNGQWRKISIDELVRKKLVVNERANDCQGYVLVKATSDDEINSKAYINCKNIYDTKKDATVLSSKNENKTKTQSENDTVKPTIKLLGKSVVTVKVDSKYKDKGAVATDNVDGNITKSIKVKSTVDTSEEGEYKVLYSVIDSSGNKSVLSRKVIVKEDATEEEKDTTEPVITFNSNLTQNICIGKKPNISKSGLYGYSAYDDVDGDVTNKVKVSGATSKAKTVGTFSLKYTVTDSSGNKAFITKNYTVTDCSTSSSVTSKQTTKPETEVVEIEDISINCPTSMTVGSTFNMSVYITPENATDRNITYSVSNTEAAFVDKGIINAKQPAQNVLVTVKSNNGKYKSCKFNIN